MSNQPDLLERPLVIRALYCVALIALIVVLYNLNRTKPAWIDEVMFAHDFKVFVHGDDMHGQSLVYQGFYRMMFWLNVCQSVVLGPFGVSMTSVRLLTLGAGLSFAFVFYRYLRARGTAHGAAFAIALAVILDRILLGLVAVGRMDGAALAVAFLALYLFRVYWVKRSAWGAFFSGFCAAVAIDTWPVTLLPLISLGGLEIFEAWCADRRSLWRFLIAFAAGGICCAVVTVACLIGNMGWTEFYTNLTVVVPPAHGSRWFYFTKVLVMNAKVFPSLWLLMVFLPAAFWKNRQSALEALVPVMLVVALNLLTSLNSSSSRLAYSIPVFYAMAAKLLPDLDRRWGWAILAAVAINFSYNIGLKSVRTQREWAGRDYAEFARQLEVIPNGSSMFTHTWSVYYEGLRREWKMYTPPDGEDGPKQGPFTIPVDFVILDADHTQWPELDKADYDLVKKIDLMPGAEERYNAVIYKRRAK